MPTEKQHGFLLMLGSGNAGLSITKGKADPLLRHGWITAEWRPPYYQWVRITPDGMRALAASVEKFGLPELAPRQERRICSDCEREWIPRCRCGGRRYRYETRDVEAVA